MGCAIQNVEGLGTVIVCGSGINPRPKHCRFCGRAAGRLCDWPRVRRERIRMPALKAGQQIFWSDRGAEACEVLCVQLAPEKGVVYVGYLSRGHVMQGEYEARRDAWVANPGTCDTPCCVRHRRAVGPGRDYCMKHWNQLERVA